MKRIFTASILALIVSVTLFGCEDSDRSRKKKLAKIASQIQLSQSPSYWIYKEVRFGSTGFERVGLIYGFAYHTERGGLYDGNKIFCEDVIADYMKRYPGSVYKCEIAE